MGQDRRHPTRKRNRVYSILLSAKSHGETSVGLHRCYYAALLPRRGPHIASHCLSVCPSVCLSVCPSVCLSVRPVIVTERHVAPPSELQWHTCTFRHALRAAYRTAISAAQILVISCIASFQLNLYCHPHGPRRGARTYGCRILSRDICIQRDKLQTIELWIAKVESLPQSMALRHFDAGLILDPKGWMYVSH